MRHRVQGRTQGGNPSTGAMIVVPDVDVVALLPNQQAESIRVRLGRRFAQLRGRVIIVLSTYCRSSLMKKSYHRCMVVA